ncbi:MAG TPA: undecaprenyldiphospho-muramoylpentapeptide beta-N-acetylglucosaminyltransferase [Salinimicrobium sp.]|nr:undecaprenyldiphospho-muramoylpentapeptide beta-N-acetylglucosaminyltransferase [Salinimicrobium sp.]
MKKMLRVILSGGGTGGHIYPAISIAQELKLRNPDAEILFVGAQDRMEMQMVPNAGFKIEGLWISGFNREFNLKNLLFPFKLIKSLLKSRRIIKRFRPDVVIGTGGFASGPLLQVAAGSNIPTVIQEQNSLPGITNRILSKRVNLICTAYSDMERYFPVEKTVLTGNPIRRDLIEIKDLRDEAISFFRLDPERKTVLVLGGSLGARKINELIAEQIEQFELKNLQLIWQTGSLYYVEYRRFEKKGLIQTYSFLSRMDYAYAAADIIISRAGAGTVSELCVVGKPVVFIPSPNVAEDHQTKNALAISKENAAVVIAEKDLEKEFEKIFYPLLESAEKMESMANNIKVLARPNATSDIVDQVERLINRQQ